MTNQSASGKFSRNNDVVLCVILTIPKCKTNSVKNKFDSKMHRCNVHQIKTFFDAKNLKSDTAHFLTSWRQNSRKTQKCRRRFEFPARTAGDACASLQRVHNSAPSCGESAEKSLSNQSALSFIYLLNALNISTDTRTDSAMVMGRTLAMTPQSTPWKRSGSMGQRAW